MLRINVGCGASPTQGWRNFDNSLSLRLAKIPLVPDLLTKIGFLAKESASYVQFCRQNRIEQGDVTKGLPLENGSVEVLYSSHMFEHLDKQESLIFLEEARRVLCSGGIIRLAVPDLRAMAEEYIKTGDADAFVYAARMTMPRPRKVSERMRLLLVGTRHHQWMYDGVSLSKLLEAHGFISAKVLEPGQSMIEEPQNLNLRERSPGTAYVEAVNP